MLQYHRDDIIKMFKKTSFPKELVRQDCLNHSDIIFSKESSETNLIVNHKLNSKDFFFYDTEEKRPKFQKEIPTENNTMNWRTQKAEIRKKSKENKQQRPQQKGKGKNVEIRPIENKIDIQPNPEPSIEQEKPRQEDISNDNQSKNTNQQVDTKVNPVTQIQGNIGYNQNPIFSFIQQQNAFFQQFMQPNIMIQNDPYFDPNFDIKVLEKYNKKLQFPDNLPLWYLFHPMLKSSFGPLTTLQIENMFNSKQIFSNSMIRFLDIYERKDSDQFNFFPIKELENENLLNEIIPSKVLKYLYLDNLNNLQTSNNNQKLTNDLNVNQTNEISPQETPNKKEEEWDEVLQPAQTESAKNNKKSGKKKRQRNKLEDFNSNNNNKNYNPSISTYNNNPNTTNLVNSTNDDNENWEEVKKPKKTEKRGNKIVGTNATKPNNNSATNINTNTQINVNINVNNPPAKKPSDNKAPQIDGTKLVEALNPKKKLDPSIEIIETDYVNQPNQKSGTNKKGKKGGKAKFTDLNLEIGLENTGGDIYKVESKKKK